MNRDYVLRELKRNDNLHDRAYDLMMRQQIFSERYNKSKMLWLIFMGRGQAIRKIYHTGAQGR